MLRPSCSTVHPQFCSSRSSRLSTSSQSATSSGFLNVTRNSQKTEPSGFSDCSTFATAQSYPDKAFLMSFWTSFQGIVIIEDVLIYEKSVIPKLNAYTAKMMQIIQMIVPLSMVVPNRRRGRHRKYVKSEALEDSTRSHINAIAVHKANKRQKIFRTII